MARGTSEFPDREGQRSQFRDGGRRSRPFDDEDGGRQGATGMGGFMRGEQKVFEGGSRIIRSNRPRRIPNEESESGSF